jgi:AcrR family transcriptional regulator
MTSIRHKRMRRSTDDAALDATRDCVLAVGVRRTTLTDVARRAGVSRMTLYRRWPDVRTLVADLMTREFVTLITEVTRVRGHHPAGPAVVDGLVNGVRAFRAHPLFRKIVDVDPELLLPYLLDRRGASQEAMLRLLEQDLRAGHRDGSILMADTGGGPEGQGGAPGAAEPSGGGKQSGNDTARQARAVLLVAQSFVMSAHTMADDGDAAALDDELRRILERYLLA